MAQSDPDCAVAQICFWERPVTKAGEGRGIWLGVGVGFIIGNFFCLE